MPDVVKQRGQLDEFSVVCIDAPRVRLVKGIKQATGEMVGPKRVGKAVVRRAREDEFTRGQLLDIAKTLEFPCVKDGGMRGRNEDVPVNFVTDDPVGRPRHRFFGVASAHQPPT